VRALIGRPDSPAARAWRAPIEIAAGDMEDRASLEKRSRRRWGVQRAGLLVGRRAEGVRRAQPADAPPRSLASGLLLVAGPRGPGIPTADQVADRAAHPRSRPAADDAASGRVQENYTFRQCEGVLKAGWLTPSGPAAV